MTSPTRCRGGIIAAGDGSRLRATGFAMPKPLVPVAGVPLIDWVIGNFQAAGITSLVVIVNEQARACRDWVLSRFPDLDVEVIVKTTRSSLESFLEVNRRLAGDRALISTVDAWCRPGDFAGFVQAALRRPADASVLAVTPLVADDRPLWVDVDAAGRIRRLGGSEGTYVTAGLYMLSERARAASPASQMCAMPMPRAPAMSRESESPTKVAWPDGRPSSRSACVKMRGSGFVQPTSAESTITPNSGRRPRSSLTLARLP